MQGWLTPDTPATGYICRRLLIPNSEKHLAIVSGCLLALTKERNFEQLGTATPEETAAAFGVMFEEYSLSGACRMIGEIIMFAGATAPNDHWLACHGQSLLRADYPDLFSVIGLTYDSGFTASDSTHFRVPILNSRSPVGVGQDPFTSANISLADIHGENGHTLTLGEMPSHYHTESVALPALGAAITGVPVPSAVPGVNATSPNGGSEPHNTYHPVLGLQMLIYAK